MLTPLALLAAAPFACVHRDDVRIRVTHGASPGSPPIENLTVFVGGTKSWWPMISPGESVSAVLPPEGVPPDITMIYTLSGKRHDWKGPSLPRSGGSLVAIRIAPDGSATERHCPMPCSLP